MLLALIKSVITESLQRLATEPKYTITTTALSLANLLTTHCFTYKYSLPYGLPLLPTHFAQAADDAKATFRLSAGRIELSVIQAPDYPKSKTSLVKSPALTSWIVIKLRPGRRLFLCFFRVSEAQVRQMSTAVVRGPAPEVFLETVAQRVLLGQRTLGIGLQVDLRLDAEVVALPVMAA